MDHLHAANVIVSWMYVHMCVAPAWQNAKIRVVVYKWGSPCPLSSCYSLSLSNPTLARDSNRTNIYYTAHLRNRELSSFFK